jgi:hypothetical protein
MKGFLKGAAIYLSAVAIFVGSILFIALAAGYIKF